MFYLNAQGPGIQKQRMPGHVESVPNALVTGYCVWTLKNFCGPAGNTV